MSRLAIIALAAALSLISLSGCMTKRKIAKQEITETEYISRDTMRVNTDKEITLSDSVECILKHYSYFADSVSTGQRIKEFTEVRLNKIKKGTEKGNKALEKASTKATEYNESHKEDSKTEIKSSWETPIIILIILFTIILILIKL